MHEIAAGSAERTSPHQLPRRIQPGHERVLGAGADQGSSRRSQSKVGRAGKVARHVDIPAGSNRHSVCRVVARPALLYGPNEIARSVQSRDEDVVAAGACQVRRCRAGIEVGGLLELARHIDTAVAGGRQTVPDVVARPAHLGGPYQIASPVQLGHEDIRSAGAD